MTSNEAMLGLKCILDNHVSEPICVHFAVMVVHVGGRCLSVHSNVVPEIAVVLVRDLLS